MRKAALSNLAVVYNRASGFLGHQIKLEDEKKDQAVNCSEYDRLFLIFSNGLYKITPVTEKLYVGDDLEWFGVMKKDMVFNVIYRDGAENYAYAKRFKSPSFILDKEYWLFAEHKRSKILLLDFGEEKFAKIKQTLKERDESQGILNNSALPALLNPYGVIRVNPTRHPHVKTELAKRFTDYLVSQTARKLITSLRVNGEQLFFIDE